MNNSSHLWLRACAVPFAVAIAAPTVTSPLANAYIPAPGSTFETSDIGLKPSKVDSLGRPVAGAKFSIKFCSYTPGALEFSCTTDYTATTDEQGRFIMDRTSSQPWGQFDTNPRVPFYIEYGETQAADGYVIDETKKAQYYRASDQTFHRSSIIEGNPRLATVNSYLTEKITSMDNPVFVNTKKFSSPEVVKVDENNNRLSGGVFTVEVCRGTAATEQCETQDSNYESDTAGVLRNFEKKSISEAIVNPSNQPMRIVLTEKIAPTGAFLNSTPQAFTFTPDVGWRDGSGALLDGVTPTAYIENPTIPFTIYKTDQYGNKISGARADIEVCNRQVETDPWTCTTHADQEITADGQVAKKHINYSVSPLWKVSATEVKAPEGFEISNTIHGPFYYDPKTGWSRSSVDIVNTRIVPTVVETLTETVTPTVTEFTIPSTTITNLVTSTATIPVTSVVVNTVEVTNTDNVVVTSTIPTTITTEATEVVTLTNVTNETNVVNATNVELVTSTVTVPVTSVAVNTVELTNTDNVVVTSTIPTTITTEATEVVTLTNVTNETNILNETATTVVTETSVVPVTSTQTLTTMVESPMTVTATNTINDTSVEEVTQTLTTLVPSEKAVTVVVPVTKLIEKTVELTEVTGVVTSSVVAATTTEVALTTKTLNAETATVTSTAPVVTVTRAVPIATGGIFGNEAVKQLVAGMDGNWLPLIGGSLALGSLGATAALAGGGLNAESLGGARPVAPAQPPVIVAPSTYVPGPTLANGRG